MILIITIIIFIILGFPLYLIYKWWNRPYVDRESLEKSQIESFRYYKKRLMSKYELYFFDVLKKLNEEGIGFIVLPQVPLSAIIEKRKTSQDRFFSILFTP